MESIEIKESALTACFVSPDLCQVLLTLGMYARPLYRWKIFNSGMRKSYASLTTSAFDPDGYYDASRHVIDTYSQPQYLPAYSIMDIERIVPDDYTLAFSRSGEYLLMPSTLYPELEGGAASRLPDVFARVAIEALQKRLIDTANIKHLAP